MCLFRRHSSGMDNNGHDYASLQAGGRIIPITESVAGARIVGLADAFPSVWGEKYKEHDSAWQCIACATPIDRQSNDDAVFVTGGDSIVHPDDIALAQNDTAWMGLWPICRECIEALPPEWRATF